MSKKIVFINQSSGYLMIDIVNAFKTQYDQRILLAGLVNPRNKQLDQDVKVEHIVKYDRSSTIRRLYTWSWGFLQILFLIKWKYRDAHLFLVSNPPLAPLLPLFCRNSYSLLIYDVFPDSLVEYKIFGPESLIVKWWKNANRRLYPKAKQVFTLSEGMRQLVAKYNPDGKIEVVPVWTDNTFLKPVAKSENPFLQEQGLTDKFLVLYSGNLGKSHDIEHLVSLADEMDHSDIFFLIIGSGDKYEIIQKKIADSRTGNIRLLPWQPTEKLPFTLAAADIGVVSLGKEASLLSMPSKTFNLMSVGAPILAIADPDSALAELIEGFKIGACFSPGQIEQMKAFILQMKEDQPYRERLRSNAIQASHHFTPENANLFKQYDL